MLTHDQLATIRAALRYWRDEIVPGGGDLSSLYFDTEVETDLTAEEIKILIEHLQPDKTRCVLVTPDEFVLAVTRQPASETGPNRNATLIFGPEIPPANL